MHAEHSIDFRGSSTESKLAGFCDLGFRIWDSEFIKRIEFLFYQDNEGGHAGVRLKT